MKVITPDTKLRTYDGKVIVEADKEMTLGFALIQLLNTATEDKVAAYKLAMRLSVDEPVEVTDAEVSLLRQITEASKLTPLYVGQIIELLEEKV